MNDTLTFESPKTSATAGRGGDSCPASCSPSRLHLDLFSGIGGFALAARWTGWNTIALSEIDDYANKLLAQNFPGIPNLGDIRNVRGVHCDLLTGGFPCQPYSNAGKRRGAEDDRALWPEMLRVIDESKPRWVLGENVAGIVNMELDRVLSDLEALGYAAWPVVIPACAVDAKHRRDRVWIVAYASSAGLQRQRRERELGKDSGQIKAARNGEALADAVRGRQPRQGQPLHAEHPASSANRQATESLDGRQPEVWLTEPAVGRVANGIPNRVDRLKGLGNAIVPQVAAAIMREMARMENNTIS